MTMIVFWALFMLPTSCLREVNSLRFTSFIGVLVMVYLTVAVGSDTITELVVRPNDIHPVKPFNVEFTAILRCAPPPPLYPQPNGWRTSPPAHEGPRGKALLKRRTRTYTRKYQPEDYFSLDGAPTSFSLRQSAAEVREDDGQMNPVLWRRPSTDPRFCSALGPIAATVAANGSKANALRSSAASCHPRKRLFTGMPRPLPSGNPSQNVIMHPSDNCGQTGDGQTGWPCLDKAARGCTPPVAGCEISSLLTWPLCWSGDFAMRPKRLPEWSSS